MNDQYYTADPTSASRPVACTVLFHGHSLRFETDAGVFSKGELDKGTELLLEALPPLHGAVLDLGCGWDALSQSLKKDNPALTLTLVDVNHRALALAEKNAAANGVSLEVLESDGFAALAGRRFDWVVTNPPIRAGKQVIYGMTRYLRVAPRGRAMPGDSQAAGGGKLPQVPENPVWTSGHPQKIRRFLGIVRPGTPEEGRLNHGIYQRVL